MSLSVLPFVQRRLGLALRARVAGEDAPERARQIWAAEGERWFTPDDPVWRVHADASMFPGGLAALLLQSLHPLAMAGVAGHSGYKGDPWGRLQRTSHYLAVTTFGTVDDAKQTIEVVRSVHRRVRGKDERGASVVMFGTEPMFRDHPKGLFSQVARAVLHTDVTAGASVDVR